MDTGSIKPQVVAFIDSHELAVVKQALAAMHDAVDLKDELGLPLCPETRAAIDELEAMVVSLKLALLRHHPNQLELPLDLPAEEREHEADDDAASCPVLLSNVLGS